VVLFMAFTFMASPAKAQVPPCTDADPTTGGCPTGGGTGLPINSGVIYLLIAGFAVGILAVKKHEAATLKA